MSHNTFAITKDYSHFAMRLRYTTGSGYTAVSNLSYSQRVFNVMYVDRVAAAVSEIGLKPADTQYLSVTSKFNLVAVAPTQACNSYNALPYQSGTDPAIYAVVLNNSQVSWDNENVQVLTTDWYDSDAGNYKRTFTYIVSFLVPVSSVPANVTSMSFGVEYPGRLQTTCPSGANYYFEGGTDNRLEADFSTDKQSALLNQQIQLQQMTINAQNATTQAVDDLNNTIQNHNNQEQQSLDNISDQTTNDIDGATNQQTDNLIGVLSSFIAAFQNVNATNCNLTLDFPNFAGGTRIVNICSGKERAPRIIEIGSSLLLIGVFVPLAFIMIRMIYNEIRSWTNG